MLGVCDGTLYTHNHIYIAYIDLHTDNTYTLFVSCFSVLMSVLVHFFGVCAAFSFIFARVPGAKPQLPRPLQSAMALRKFMPSQ